MRKAQTTLKSQEEGGLFVDFMAPQPQPSAYLVRGKSPHRLGADRVFQHYAQASKYDFLVTLTSLPKHIKIPDDRPRELSFWAASQELDAVWGMKNALAGGTALGLFGYTVIDGRAIHSYVQSRLSWGHQMSQLSQSDGMYGVKDIHKWIWPRLSPNPRGLLSVWISDGIFEPARRAPQRDKGGSRFDEADLVTIGLIQGLVQAGVPYRDFTGLMDVTSGPR